MVGGPHLDRNVMAETWRFCCHNYGLEHGNDLFTPKVADFLPSIISKVEIGRIALF